MKKLTNEELINVCNSNINLYEKRLILLKDKYESKEISIQEYWHQKLTYDTKIETYKEIKELLEG